MRRRVLVERKLLTTDENGKVRPIYMRVGPLRSRADGGAACRCEVEGLLGISEDIHGVDRWQALSLAMQLAEQIVTGFAETQDIRWPDGSAFGKERAKPRRSSRARKKQSGSRKRSS